MDRGRPCARSWVLTVVLLMWQAERCFGAIKSHVFTILCFRDCSTAFTIHSREFCGFKPSPGPSPNQDSQFIIIK